jgi:hypothetical protein
VCIVPANFSFEDTGKDQQFELFQGYYPELAEKDVVLKYKYQIPQTSKDAMRLVLKLCDQHLRVDALCIVQDRHEDRKDQLPAIDHVYGSSVLAIAATYGTGADAGLPGVLFNSWEPMTRVEMIRGIRLGNNKQGLRFIFNKSQNNVSTKKCHSRNNIMLHTMCLR